MPYKNPNNYVKVSGRLAEQLARERAERRDLGQPVRQCRQPRRPYPHDGRRRSGRQTGGKVDGFVSAVGTGGTLAGVAFGLKARNPDVKIALADPLGAALYSFYTEGVLKAEGSSITEGIGQGRITANLEGFTPDFSCQITDEEALPIVFDLVQEEGLCLGGSTGINIAGAIRLARELGPGPHHRDHPVRLRHALSVETVQPGIPALQGPAGAGLDGAATAAISRAATRRWRDGVETEALFRDDAYLRDDRRQGRAQSTTAAASCSTGRSSMRPRAASPAIPAASSAPTAADRDRRAPSPARPRTRSSMSRRPGRRCPSIGEAAGARRSTGSGRYRLMRMHTACHLLTVVCPFPITGAAVAEDESRVDFDIPDAGFTKEDVTRALMELVAADHPVFTRWITDEELAANPGLVKSKNVRPPAGTGAHPAGLHRRQRRGRQPALRRHPCARRPARSVRSISARSRRKAARTAASGIRFGPLPGG